MRTAESIAKVRNLGSNWGMCSEHCNTGSIQGKNRQKKSAKSFCEVLPASWSRPRVWHNIICAAASGPCCCWCLCPAAGEIQRALVSKVLSHDDMFVRCLRLPTVSYGSEVWGPSCSPSLPRDIKKMADVQIAFFRQLCRLERSVTPAIIFRELSERPWVSRWWSQVIGFMHRLSDMPDDSIHAELLRERETRNQQG